METWISWRYSLVSLVAVPHFDSSFDKTDHIFILSTNEFKNTKQKMSDGGKHISSTGCCKPPDLKEGERCPLEETLGVTNFSMELL